MSDFASRPSSALSVSRRKKRWADHGSLPALILFIPPAFVLFAVFVIMPMINAAAFSFYDWNGYGPLVDFVGVDNYDDVLTHRKFGFAVRNSLMIIGVSLFIQLPLAMWAALALIEKAWSISVIRVLFFLPYMLAEVAAGLIWKFTYDGDYGMLAVVGDLIGTEMPYVLGDKSWVMPAILLVIIWKYFGFHMMIYIAGLQSIPSEVIEAARLDGVSRGKIMWFIKIPMIKSSIAISVFFSIIGALQLFDLIIPLSGGGPSHVSHTIVSFLYNFGIIHMKLGFGGAVSVLLFAACVVVTLLYRKFVFAKLED
jgi:raffinose/stachyose/melibiose transport system permease protein